MKQNIVKSSSKITRTLALLISVFLVALFPSTVFASAVKTNSHVINLSSHRIGVPGYHQNSSYFIGYGLSYDYRFATQAIGWFKYYSKLTVGGFQQSYYQNAFYGGGSFGFGYQSSMGIEMYLSLGAAYQRSFDDAAVYELNKEGNFEQVRDYGHSSLIVPFAFELGYQFSNNSLIGGLYIQYRFDIQTPFAPANNLPIVGHEYLTLGVRF